MSYFLTALDPSRNNVYVEEAVARLSTPELASTFDAIAFTGGSGAAIAPVVAYLLKKQLIVVRKSGQQSHCGMGAVSTHITSGSYIFLDDFTSSGGTVEEAVTAIKRYYPRLSLAGLYFYKQSGRYTGVQNRIGRTIPILNRHFHEYDEFKYIPDEYTV